MPTQVRTHQRHDYRIDQPVTVEQLSSAQYVWHQAGERGYAHPDRLPARRSFDAGPARLTLPPLSVTVLRTGQAPTAGG